jgi:uncharacterized protein YecE (DUF72 family)
MADQAELFTSADKPGLVVAPAVQPAAVLALGRALAERWGGRLYLGTSSWYFPGWAGQVWARAEAQARLSRHGLAAYARHPLLRTVSLDRALYRPLEPAIYQELAAQVDADFRFVVKVPALVSDARQRTPGTGAPVGENPLFLDPQAALDLCARPLAQGLGPKLGVLVLQLSPLPARWLDDVPALLLRLAALLAAIKPLLPDEALLALELRDASLLTPDLAALLRRHGARYALGLHDRMPELRDQLPMLRATWPGDLVCRWNLQRGLRYTQARERWEPFDRIQSHDLQTRQALARVLRATLDAGQRAFVTINNKAEGCAPASVLALAQELLADQNR